MRVVSYFAASVIAISSTLTGCVADSSDLESIDLEDSAQEEVSESGEALGTCSGNSCNGLDPGATGCEGDAVTRAATDLVSSGVVVGRVAIRYSPSCNAAWARVSTTNPYGQYLRAEIKRISPAATAQAAPPYPDTALRSPMLGVTAGSKFTATGKIGAAYNTTLYSGSVNTTF
jgi:hypothetical protein